MATKETNYAKFLIEALGTEIHYVQKPTHKAKIPYSLTVKGYRYLYLNSQLLGELTPEEQVILISSTEGDPHQTPENTVAGIYKARRIRKISKTQEEAIENCYNRLVDENNDFMEESNAEFEEIGRLSQKANELEYYLKIKKDMEEYKRSQESSMSSVINFKDRILHIFKRKHKVGPPHKKAELEYGKKLWNEFRKSQKATTDISNEELLKRFIYGPNDPYSSSRFEYIRNQELLDALQEEYNISNIALQIIDGSAYKLAKEKVTTKSFFPYFNYINRPIQNYIKPDMMATNRNHNNNQNSKDRNDR